MLGLSWLASSFGKASQRFLWLSLPTATRTVKHPAQQAALKAASHYGEQQGCQHQATGGKPSLCAV